ncbi:hypothetical protein ACW19A_02370 [Limosilactobacillus fermentum]
MGHRRFLIINGFETLATGIFMSVQHHLMQDDPHTRIVHVTQHLGDVNWALILAIVGVYAIMAGACRYEKAQRWALIALGSLWCAYLFAFVVQDLYFPGQIGISTLLTLFVLVGIFVEAVSNDGGGR